MNKLVLIIDDSSDIRENTAELLELSGYKTVTAANGKEGLEKAHLHHPDLILCDVMMPELDGYGVLRALQNIPALSTTPFIFLTAKAEPGDFRIAMDLGADDYLTKPFTGDELIRVVGARLKKHQDLKAQTEQHQGPGMEELPLNRTMKKLRSKDMIYMEGDTATHLFFVISGKVKTFKTNQWGKEYITEIVNENEFFGYLPLLGDLVHHHAAMAIEPAEIALIPRQEFLDILGSNHEVSLQFMSFLSENMVESEEKLLQLAYNSARKRVAEALLFLYHQYENKEKPDFSFPVNRENLSAIAGISPESVSRNLSDFREENLIATDNGYVRITNLSKLAGMKC